MPVIAVVEFQVNVSGLFMPVTAKVVENPVRDLILGASFMKYNQVSIDFRTKMVSMADDLVRAPLQSDKYNRTIEYRSVSPVKGQFVSPRIARL